MTVTYRRSRPNDVAGIAEVNRAAYNALSQRHGFPEVPVAPPHPFLAFSVQQEPEGCWVAADGDTIVGFTISWVRGDFWFLAYLFIAPTLQAQGVGRALIERALAHAGHAATNRALITFAYNPASIALYVRYAMYPQEPLYVLEGLAETFRARGEGPQCPAYQRLTPDAGSVDLRSRLDQAVLGMVRIRHHEFFLNAPGSVCYLFGPATAPSGYAYVWPTGRVGPLLALSPSSFERIMWTGLSLASASTAERVSVLLAGSNAPALAWALGQGMRIRLPLLLMATKPFGRLDAYGFHSPMLM